MKAFTIECEKCGADTKVKALDEAALADWHSSMKKQRKDILCRSCKKKSSKV